MMRWGWNGHLHPYYAIWGVVVSTIAGVILFCRRPWLGLAAVLAWILVEDIGEVYFDQLMGGAGFPIVPWRGVWLGQLGASNWLVSLGNWWDGSLIVWPRLYYGVVALIAAGLLIDHRQKVKNA